MASAIGIALISTILPPMAAKAMEKVKAMVVDKVDGIANIEGDISSLHSTLCVIEGIVQVAEKKQIDDEFIRNWLRDLVDIGYEARDVLDDFITFSSCTITAEEAKKPVNTISSFMLSCFCGLSRDTSKLPLPILNRLANDIRSVRERFEEKKNEGETFRNLRSVVVGGSSESVHVERRPEVGPSINKDALFSGREDVKEKIMEKILHPSDDNRVHVVAIWGMGGIGKTTLAQSIYNDERVKEDDYPSKNRRWLCVGENKFSAKEIITKIVNDSISTTNDVENLQTKLVEKLRGDRFLIVLDDVWDVDGSEWDLLFNPLTDVGKGGLIIITTRKREVCTATNTQTTYDLKPLSEKDSWSLFESCAYKDGKSDSTPDLKRTGEEIVKKLNGLPLALKVVGRSLLNEDDRTWTDFLNSNADDVMSALRWSYNLLRPPHLKHCFAYCALFPKDHEFDEKVLVEMWMAHDLIKKEKQKRPEDVGANYFKQLVNASLLQCVDGKHVMHDLIHDLALLVSNGEFASTISSSLTNDQMETVRHITITPDDYSKIPRLCMIEKLLTLYTIRSYKVDTNWCDDVDDVFKQLKSIRVLVLCNKGIKEIPDCISQLRHLRYLDVSETSVESLPNSLCYLYNLQMLAAQLYAVLPRDIVNIRSLNYVRAHLPTCRGIEKLTSLQEMSSIRVCKDDNIRELGDMQRLRGKLRIEGLANVEKLEDNVGALMEKQTLMDELELVFNQHSAKSTISAQVLDALGCPPNLKCLKIANYEGLKPPSWMVDGKHKFDKLQTLELSFCTKLESLPPLGELISLKHLSLTSLYGVKRLGDEFYGKFTDGKVFFPSLESLKFSYLRKWEEWDDIIIENSRVSFFPRLTELEIKFCAKLVSVLPVVKNPTSSVANFMTFLSSLKIRNCDELKRLQLDALVSLKELKIDVCSSLVQITSAICERLEISSCRLLEKMDVARCDTLVVIKILKLEDCESLRSLNINIHGLDSLEHLHIIDCSKLESLPPLGELTSLKSLYLFKVGVKRLGDEFYGKFTDGKVFFPSLESLDFLYMNEWEEWDDIIIKNSNVSFFPRLTKLEVRYCSKLVSVLPVVKNSIMSDANFMKSLSRLEISYCDGLRYLQIKGCPSLRYLQIKGCPLLYERCRDESGPDWHKIKHIPYKYISLLDYEIN